MKLITYSMIIAAVFGTTIFSAEPVAKNPKPRIGVYDSRAVAIAFAGSDAHKKSMAPLFEEHKRATAAGDTQRVKKLEAEGKARQKKAHEQAFSTAPVDDILEHIKGQLPGIQEAAGLRANTELISRWDKKALARHKSAEQIDVTGALIDAFHPNEKQRQSAMEVQQRKPIAPKLIKD